MTRVWKPFCTALALLAALALFSLATDRAGAQEPQSGATAPADSAQAAAPAPAPAPPAATPAASAAPAAPAAPGDVANAPTVRAKHPHLFAASARFDRRVPVRILKANERNLNDITAAASGYSGGLRCYLLDGMAVGLRYARGGLEMTDNPGDLALFPDLHGDEYLQLDSYTLWVAAYLGNRLFPKSRCNPYLTMSVSRYDWAFTHDGRGGDPYMILEDPLEGKDMGLAGGFGAEYALASRVWLEAEWTWNYALTALARQDGEYAIWTNTQFWNLSLGLIAGF